MSTSDTARALVRGAVEGLAGLMPDARTLVLERLSAEEAAWVPAVSTLLADWRDVDRALLAPDEAQELARRACEGLPAAAARELVAFAGELVAGDAPPHEVESKAQAFALRLARVVVHHLLAHAATGSRAYARAGREAALGPRDVGALPTGTLMAARSDAAGPRAVSRPPRWGRAAWVATLTVLAAIVAVELRLLFPPSPTPGTMSPPTPTAPAALTSPADVTDPPPAAPIAAEPAVPAGEVAAVATPAAQAPIAGDDDALPRGLLHAALTRDPLGSGASETTLVVVVGAGPTRSRGATEVGAVRRTQQERLRGFLVAIPAGVDDAFLKRLHAWAMCPCASHAACQGGAAPCVQCAACVLMPEEMAGALPMAEPVAPAGGPRPYCPPKNVSLVVDVSGSMAEERKLEHVQRALRELLRHLRPGDVVSLVAFSDRARVVRPPTVIAHELGETFMTTERPIEELVREDPARAGVLTDLLASIDALRPEGGTDVYSALQLGASLLDATPAQRQRLDDPTAINRVVLFSDGLHRATRSTPETLAQFHALVEEVTRGRASVSTFGVGRSFDERLLARIAEAGLHGRYYHLAEAAQAARLLREDLMLPLVAKDLRLEVRLAPGVTAEPLAGRLRAVTGRPGELVGSLGSLGEDDKRAVAVRLTLPGAPDEGQARDMAQVTLRYLRDDGEVVERQDVRVRVSSTTDAPVAAASLGVTEEWIIQDARDAALRAYELLADGKAADARGILEEALARLAAEDYR